MNFVDFLLILVRNRWTIIISVTIVTLLSLIVSLILPKYYRSTATIIPISADGGGISSLLGGYSLNIFDRNVIVSESYANILSSQSLKDSLIQKFDLFTVYEVEYKEEVYEAIDEHVEIEVDKVAGIGYSPIKAINVSVLDKIPDQAAEMANFCIHYLYDKIHDLNRLYDYRKFDFISNRYAESRAELREAEEQLRDFQDQHGLFEVTEQMKLMIQNLAQLEAERERLEIELAVAAQTLDKSNPLYRKIQTELKIVSDKVSELKAGGVEEKSIIFYSLEDVPQLGMQYFRLYREIEIHHKILEMMTIQFEQTRMQVDKDIPPLLILDNAQPATYKYKPKRALIVLAGFFFSLFVTVVYIFLVSFYREQRRQDTDLYKKLDEAISLIKSDFKRSKK